MKRKASHRTKKAEPRAQEGEKDRAQHGAGKGEVNHMFGAASVICLSVLFVIAFGFCLYFLQSGALSRALWCGVASLVFAIFGVAFYVQGYVIRPESTAKPSQEALGQQSSPDPKMPLSQPGHLSIIRIDPTPPKLTVGEKAFEIITWGNEGDAPIDISGGFIQNFVSFQRPSEVVIHCERPSEGAIMPLQIARIPRTQKYTNSDANVYNRVQVDAVNQGKAFFGICGQVNYTTGGQASTLDFCSYYDPDEKAWMDCKKDATKATKAQPSRRDAGQTVGVESGVTPSIDVKVIRAPEKPAQTPPPVASVKPFNMGPPNYGNPDDWLKWTDYTEDYFHDAIWRWEYRPQMGDRKPRNITAWCPECDWLMMPLHGVAIGPGGVHSSVFVCGNHPLKQYFVPGAGTDHYDGIRDLIRGRLENGTWKDVVKRQRDARGQI